MEIHSFCACFLRHLKAKKKKYILSCRDRLLENQKVDNLLQDGLFMKGLLLGAGICHRMLLAAHERGEPLTVEGKPYHVLDGDQLLQQMLDAVCDG